MKPGKFFQPTDSVYPFMGIDTLDPSGLMNPKFSPNCDNVTVTKGVIAKRKGYTQIGEALSGVVLEIIEFVTGSGTKKIVVVTTTNQYVWSGSAWSDITRKNTKVNLTHGAVTGTFTVGMEVTQATSGAKGTYMGDAGGVISLSYISGTFDASHDISSGANTTTVSVLALVDNAGNAFPWTGDETYGLDWVVGTDDSGKYLFISNNKDAPLWWDGSWGNFRSFVPNISGFVSAKTLSVFGGRLCLSNVLTTVRESAAFAWSVVGDFDDFTGEGSGSATLTETLGDIELTIPLGDRLIVYGSESIGDVTYVGGDLIFSFSSLVQDTRLVSPRCVVNLGPFHLFLTNENVQLFDGTRMLRPMADAIHPDLREKYDHGYPSHAFAFHDSTRRQVYWVVPTSVSTSNVYLLEYDSFDLSKTTWTRLNYADRPTGLGWFSRESTLVWSAVSVAWDKFGDPWNAGAIKAGFPVRTMGGTTKVFSCDDTSYLDGATEVVGSWESIDFTVPQIYQSVFARWIEAELEIRGTSVRVDVSFDSGNNWTEVETLTLSGTWEKKSILFDGVGRTLRVRLYSPDSSSSFELRWLRVWGTPGGGR